MASARALKITSLSEAGVSGLMRAIARGDLRPGGAAQTKRIHGADARVSRGPIREARAGIGGQGFLVSRPNQGFYVVVFAPQSSATSMRRLKTGWRRPSSPISPACLSPPERREDPGADRRNRRLRRLTFTETLLAFRLRVLARLDNRFLADLMTVMYRKFYIFSVVVDSGDDSARIAASARCCGGSGPRSPATTSTQGSCVLRDDTAYCCRSSGPEFRPMNAPIKNSIAALAPEVDEWRRDFHRHPELLYQMPAHAGAVAERLRASASTRCTKGSARPASSACLHGAKGAGADVSKPACCCAPTWTRCRSWRRPAPNIPLKRRDDARLRP